MPDREVGGGLLCISPRSETRKPGSLPHPAPPLYSHDTMTTERWIVPCAIFAAATFFGGLSYR